MLSSPGAISCDHSVSNRLKPVSPRHFLYIDSLRGIAVAGVIAVHVSLRFKLTGTLDATLKHGAYGVQLFYLVSALTLMMSMAKRNHSERNPTLNFFIRRIFRIAPAFYFIFLAYSLLVWADCLGFLSVTRVTIPQSLVVIGFLNGFRPDLINNAPVVGQWSIAVEMMFYVLLPCIFVCVLTFRSALYAWWGSIFLFLFSTPLAAHLSALEGFSGSPSMVNDFAYWWFPSQLPVFLSGIGLYMIMTEKRSLWRSILPYLPGVLLVWILHHFDSNIALFPLAGVVGTVFVVLIARYTPRMFVNQITAFWGKISFSAYLCHPLVLIPINAVMRPDHASTSVTRFAMMYAATLLGVSIVSYLMWKLIEIPGQRLGKYIVTQLEARSAQRQRA